MINIISEESKELNISTAVYTTIFGKMAISYTDSAITAIRIVDKDIPSTPDGKSALSDKMYNQILEYFDGRRKEFDIPVIISGTEFQRSVLKALLNIPYGETRTYKDIAVEVGNEKACRAVGSANNKNILPIIIPCHRVIGSNGKLVGYAGGLDMKKSLLEIEETNQ